MNVPYAENTLHRPCARACAGVLRRKWDVINLLYSARVRVLYSSTRKVALNQKLMSSRMAVDLNKKKGSNSVWYIARL